LSGRLAERIRGEIAERGPITFAAFMEAALYDPEEGFYARPPVGLEGHFLTSPHVSPVFGILVARQVAEAFDLLGEPEAFTVVEWAAGDGTLARQILDAVEAVPRLASSLRYLTVEATPGSREALAANGLEVAGAAELPTGLTGVVLANELLDNLPFRLVRATREGLRERLVGLGPGGELAFVEVGADDALASMAGDLEEGAVAAVSDAPSRWLAQAADSLARGYIIVIDYGGAGPRAPQTYRAQQSGEDLLRDPGSADLTAGVDLAALARAAGDLGLGVWGPVSQRDALLALGFGDHAEAERVRTGEDRDAGRHLEAARRWARRSRESLLVDPAALGGLQVMVFGVGVDAPLVSVRERA
jgi:SAM-dependent MidA family methyltransferase